MVKMDYVWDRTVEFLGDNLYAVLPFAVLAIFVPTSIMNAVAPLWVGAAANLQLVLTIGVIALVIALFWGYLAITALAIDPGLRPHAAGIATRRLLPLVGAYALLAVVLGVLFVPASFLVASAGVNMAAIEAGRPLTPAAAGYGWALTAYSIVIAVVVLVVAARLVPLTAVIAAERRGVGAIARTWRLTRGMTWRLIGIAILYLVVSQVAGLAARTVFGSLLRIVAGGDGGFSVGQVITAVVVAAVSTAFTTLAAVFAAKLYVAVQRTLEPAAPIGDDAAALS